MSTVTTAHGAVVVNEIAWMGTVEDATNEWIELRNTGTESISLDGWSLVAFDGSPTISLSGVISGGEYFLIERTDDSTVPSVPADLVTTFGTGLGNTGERLRLIDADGGIVDDVDGSNGWLIEGVAGGNNDTKDTAQRISSGWITGVPTPRASNTEEETVSAITESVTISHTQSGNQTSRNGGGSSSAKKILATQKKENENPVLTLTISGPKIAYVNQEVSFLATPSGLGKTSLNSLAYTWNFGDTYTAVGKDPKHVFKYPGEYVVVVEAYFAKHRVVVRHEVKVLPVSFTLEKTSEGDVLLRNNASYEVDLGDFSLKGATSFIFPKFTILKAKGSLTIPQSRIGGTGYVALYDGRDMRVASLAHSTVSQSDELLHTVVARDVVFHTQKTDENVADLPEETVIQIGNASQNFQEKQGIFSRLLHGIKGLFN